MLHHILYDVVIAHVKAGLILKPKPSFMPELDQLLVNSMAIGYRQLAI